MGIPSKPRAVVTGAGSGLGRAFCQELARRGARILATDLNLASVEETVRSLGQTEAHSMFCDVTKLADVEAVAVEAEKRFGGTDLVINNAGVAVGGRVGEIPLESWHWIVDINLFGVVHGCHVFAPLLRRQGGGHILNVASAAGLLSAPTMAPYNATKAAVVALSETLYAELVQDHVGVSVLCPTFFQTKIADSARMYADPALTGMVHKLMSSAKVQAGDVARFALDGAERGDLHILPHRDGRWFWRLKRLFPSGFHKITPKLLAKRAGVRPQH